MFAKILARRLGRLGIHYGWIMAALCFFNMICSSAAITLPGLLIVPLTEEFGWSKADVSGAIAVMFVMFACMAPFSGALLLRYGLVRIVIGRASCRERV